MRYDNLPEYPVQPGRPAGSRLKREPSFGRLMGGLLGGFVAIGLVIRLVAGGPSSSDGSRVKVQGALPGGVVPAVELEARSTSSDAAATTASATTAGVVETTEAPGTLPPTVATTEPPATEATPAPTTRAAAPKSAATSAPAPKATTATTTKPKTTTTTTAKPATTAPKPATTAPKPAPTTAKPAPATTKATAAPTTKATSPPAAQGTPAEVKAMIQQMWPADSLDKALAVAWRESRYRPDVYNGICCYGVFQINARSHQARLARHGWTTQDLYDPQVNITIALEIFNEQGWGPWGG